MDQKTLARLEHYTGRLDGDIGPLTRMAARYASGKAGEGPLFQDGRNRHPSWTPGSEAIERALFDNKALTIHEAPLVDQREVGPVWSGRFVAHCLQVGLPDFDAQSLRPWDADTYAAWGKPTVFKRGAVIGVNGDVGIWVLPEVGVFGLRGGLVGCVKVRNVDFARVPA